MDCRQAGNRNGVAVQICSPHWSAPANHSYPHYAWMLWYSLVRCGCWCMDVVILTGQVWVLMHGCCDTHWSGVGAGCSFFTESSANVSLTANLTSVSTSVLVRSRFRIVYALSVSITLPWNGDMYVSHCPGMGTCLYHIALEWGHVSMLVDMLVSYCPGMGACLYHIALEWGHVGITLPWNGDMLVSYCPGMGTC